MLALDKATQPDAGLTCPVCAASDLPRFLLRTQVPVHQNRVFASQALARASTRGDLCMRVCRCCGFVFNQAFEATLLQYGQDYDNTQSHSGVFDAYLDRRVEDLVLHEGVRDKHVVEVGCGKGHFLRKLVGYPGSGNHGVGFDPSYLGPLSDMDGRLAFARRFYDASCADTAADVVVCRHVIEHVADPLALLRDVRAALHQRPDARVFFETPCVSWILRHQVVWDFFYEHCSLFSAQSLSLAFERAGFEVLRVGHVFDDQYLWLEARLATRPVAAVRPAASELVGHALAYADAEQSLVLAWVRQMDRWREDGPIALWGAGAKGVTFANLLDPQANRIDCVVDINPAKQGGFVAGSGHGIIAPPDLASRGVTTVVLMNPNYRQEVQRTLDAMDNKARLIDWSPACN